jgi:protein-disulfide isomerase
MADSRTPDNINGSVPGSRRWPIAVDSIAAVAMVFASLAIVWASLVRPSRPSQRTAQAVEIDMPSAPVSVDGSPSLGSATAPVVMIEFSDFQCPFCGTFSREVLPTLNREYVEPGKLRMVFKHLPLQQKHPQALEAAEAAVCAQNQGKFWQMHDLLFQPGSPLDAEGLTAKAVKLGLDVAEFSTCLSGNVARVAEDAVLAVQLGFKGTPSFLVGSSGADGRVRVRSAVYGVRPIEDFRKAIEGVLRLPVS